MTLQTLQKSGNPQRHADVFNALWMPDGSGVPKYQRFANTILDAMKGGIWAPGDRLPGEEEFVELTRMSLGTVQRGLRLLADQGLLVRRHGLGSFVAEHARRIDPPVFVQFLDDARQPLPLYSSVIRREMLDREGPWSAHLETAPGNVMRLDRIFHINGEFRVLSRFHANRAMLDRLWDAPLRELDGANFMSIIETECRLPITDITRVLRFEQFAPDVCEMLNVQHGTSGLLLLVTAMSGRDTCTFYQEVFIPPNPRMLELPDYRATFATSAAASSAAAQPLR